MPSSGVQHYFQIPIALNSSISAPSSFENARNRSFHPLSIFKTPKIAHFTRFHFSLRLKSLISSISNFRWASNHPFQPFPFFIGPQIAHFSRFRFQITRKDSQNSSNHFHFAQEIHKNLIFLRLFASDWQKFCTFAPCFARDTTYCLLIPLSNFHTQGKRATINTLMKCALYAQTSP